ncbi:MAG TPA: hypothetical protein VG097_14215 [Gemmata sp.]|jgi:hypothetical protein|nr:hypothetical protein [Gemmata sp.]
MLSASTTSSSPHGKSSALKQAAVIGLIAIAGYCAWRENLIPMAGNVQAPGPETNWTGVWFKHDAGKYDLPTLVFRKGIRGLNGRIINPGSDPKFDVGTSLEELVLAEDNLTFIADSPTRTKYRLIRTVPDHANLYVVPDTEHHLEGFTDGRGSLTVHSAAKREVVLREMSDPPAPTLIARMKRVAQTTETSMPDPPLRMSFPDAAASGKAPGKSGK